MRYRVAAWRLRLSGSVRSTAQIHVEEGSAVLLVEGEALATFGSIGDLMDAFALKGEDLIPDEET
ncbi:MAG: hypothetical protein NVS3B10_30240 [Polyangiales bacterium]